MLYYNDFVLNEVMQEMITFDRRSVFNELNSAAARYQHRLLIGDFRHSIASAIAMVMAHNCGPARKKCTREQIDLWLSAIMNRIPYSLRWKFFGDKFWKWLEKLHVRRASLEYLKFLNELEEVTLGFVSFVDMERTNKDKVREIFEPFIRTVGFDSYERYRNSCSLLIDLTRRISEPMIFREEKVREIEERWGFSEGALTLTEDKVTRLDLTNLHRNFIPIFYGGREGIRKGLAPQHFGAVNSPVKLCFSIDRAKQEIIDGAFKGRIFENFLHSALTGELILAIDPSKPFDGYVQRADKLTEMHGGKELLKKLDDSPEGINVWEEIGEQWKYHLSQPDISLSNRVKFYKYLRYYYRTTENSTGPSVIVTRNSHPSFAAFLDEQNQDQWEEDILLIHDKDPKHCLVGAARFTRKYSHKKYRSGRNHVRKFVDYLNASAKARFELAIPEEYPIVPVLFTSFTGAIHKEMNDGVIKTTILPVTLGRHLKNIKSHLARLAGS